MLAPEISAQKSERISTISDKCKIRPNKSISTELLYVTGYRLHPTSQSTSSHSTIWMPCSLLHPHRPLVLTSHPPALSSSSSSSSSEDDKEKEPHSPTRSLSTVSSLSLATSEKVKDDQGKNRQRSTFTLRSASTSSLASISSSQTVRTDIESHRTPNTHHPAMGSECYLCVKRPGLPVGT